MLQFRNLSLTYRIGIYMRGCSPVTLNLRPGETTTLDGSFMKAWRSEVKQEVATYIDKGLLEVYDDAAASALTACQVIAYT
jgi:hypothetical protein